MSIMNRVYAELKQNRLKTEKNRKKKRVGKESKRKNRK